MTDQQLNSAVDRYVERLLTVCRTSELEGTDIKIIHRPLNALPSINPYGKAFFLISVNGSYYRFLVDNLNSDAIKITARGFSKEAFNPRVLSKRDTVQVLDIIRDYLLEIILNPISNGDHSPSRTPEYLGLSCREAVAEWLSGRLNMVQDAHRYVLVDMIHG